MLACLEQIGNNQMTTSEQPATGLTTSQASEVLDITENAVRLRIKRNTLTGRKVGNSWRVYFDEQPAVTTTGDQLVSSLQAEIDFLRSELESRRREIERRDVMLAQQLAQLVEMAGQVRALESGSEQRESPEPSPSADDDVDSALSEAGEPERPRGAWSRFWRFILGE